MRKATWVSSKVMASARAVHPRREQGFPAGAVAVNDRFSGGGSLPYPIRIEVERHKRDLFGLQHMRQRLTAAAVTADDDVAVAGEASTGDRLQLQGALQPLLARHPQGDPVGLLDQQGADQQ